MPNTNDAIKYLLLAVFTFLFALIIWPFLPAIVFALVFAIIFYPFYEHLSKKINNNLAALIVLITTLVFILTPIVLFIGLVAREAITFVHSFDQTAFLKLIDQYSIVSFFGYEIDLSSYLSSILEIMKNAGQIIGSYALEFGSNILRIIFLFFVFLFVYFFFLRDGKELTKKLKMILPFTQSQNNKLITEFNRVSKTVFVGNLVAALLSGLAAYIGFILFGIPGAVIWGLLAGILSLIPTIGAFIVYAVGFVIVLFSAGKIYVIGLVIYYALIEIILLQNFVKPKLLDEKISVHPILVFFSLVGGVSVFGSIGILYGPLIVVLFVSIFDFIIGTQKA